MNPLEKRTTVSLAAVYAFRMLGLFMILPVLPLYANALEHVTPFLIGIAIGIYGLTQAIFQIPFGLLSDRIGRKPVIVAGLLLFAFGGVIAALADHNIYLIIAGRALQGMGAIAAATMALAADLTREENRAKVMASIGMSIGFAFALAMILGPLINSWLGISGLFWITTLLAICGIGLVMFAVPTPPVSYSHRDAGIIGGYLKPVLANATLLRMDLGVFLLHAIMTANFTVVPVILRDHLGLVEIDHWKVYLPVFLFSFMLSVPLIIAAEKYRKIKPVLLFSIILLLLSQLLLGLYYPIMTLMFVALLVFFTGFNFLEAVLPSLVAKYSHVDTKGTAMGVFSTSQFAGIFAGGMIGGFVNMHWGIPGVLFFGAILALFWVAVAVTLPVPRFYKTRLVRLNDVSKQDPARTVQSMLAIAGIHEASIALEEGIAYLKVDQAVLDDQALAVFSAS